MKNMCKDLLEEIISKILCKDPNTIFKVCLNSPSICSCSGLTANFNLVAEGGNKHFQTETTPKEVSIPVTVLGTTSNITVNSTGNITIPPIEVSGSTAAEDIDITVATQGTPLNVNVTGKVNVPIPELDINCTTNEEGEENTCNICEEEDGCCEYFCNTVATTVSDVSIVNGNATIPTLTSTGSNTIPSLAVKGSTETTIVPVTVSGTGSGTISATGTATGVVGPFEVDGSVEIGSLPVTGTITIEGNCTSTPVCYCGKILKVCCGVIFLKLADNSELVLPIDNIMKIEFCTTVCLSIESDINCCQCYNPCSIEELLKKAWKERKCITLLGTNTTNPIQPAIEPNDIVFIGYDFLVVKSEMGSLRCYKIYNIDNIAGLISASC